MNRYVVLVSFVATLGGFLFGFDTAVIAGTLTYLKNTFQLSDIDQGWVVSSALLGCMIGALISGVAADRYGRKPVLFLSSICYLISAVWCGLSGSLNELVLARIIGGIAIGFASTTAPIYVSEVAPPAYRGRLGMLTQLTITLGILASYFSNYVIDNSLFISELVNGNKDELWRYMFGIAAIPSAVFLLLLFFIPESPRWLVANHNPVLAKSVFRRLVKSEAEAEILFNQVSENLKSDVAMPGVKLFGNKGYRRIAMIGFFFAVFCLLTGINVVLYYAPIIFEKTNVKLPPLLQTTFTGIVLFLFTIVSLFLIDTVGRKKLLLIGSWLMGLSMGGIAVFFYFGWLDSYGILILILVFIASFAATWGSVVWVLIGEMFPNNIRGTATSFANFANWLTNFLVTISFPWMLNNWQGSGSFAFYAIINFFALLFVRKYIVETNGVSLENIEKLYTKK